MTTLPKKTNTDLPHNELQLPKKTETCQAGHTLRRPEGSPLSIFHGCISRQFGDKKTLGSSEPVLCSNVL